MNNWEPTLSDDWSNAGGCGILHPFSAAKRATCEANFAASSPKAIKAQSDLLLAQAVADKAAKEDDSSWTATQTAMVAIGALLTIGLVVVIIKRAGSKPSTAKKAKK